MSEPCGHPTIVRGPCGLHDGCALTYCPPCSKYTHQDEHAYYGAGTCVFCGLDEDEHPGWSEKLQAAVIETDAQLDAALRRRLEG